MEDTGLLIKSINDKIRQFADEQFAQFGLTSMQVGYLQYISEQNGSVYQKQLEEHFKVSHPTVVGIVKRLQDKNFLHVSVDPEDKRNRIITITEKTVEIDQKMKEGQRWIENAMIEGIKQEDINILQSVLRQIDCNLEQVRERRDK